MYIGVKKMSMQFKKFLDMILTSASGERGVTAGETAGSQLLMEGSSTCTITICDISHAQGHDKKYALQNVRDILVKKMLQLRSLSFLTLSIISVSSSTTDVFFGGGVGVLTNSAL